MRVWEWDQAVPFAALTWPLGEARPLAGPCRGMVRIDAAANDRLLDGGGLTARAHCRSR